MKQLRYFHWHQGLRIENLATGQLIWEGRPGGFPVLKVAEIPNSNDCLVLLDPGTGSKSFRNLWRYSHEEGTIWVAKLPSSAGDAYIDFEITDNNRLFANSWAGFRVEIDLVTGEVLQARFTK